ncbi:hypothetical protein [Pedobacter jejuensis]|uniref:Uncharacterized protein n=1 Tax=Pedobacter jejuensis TaxID=1268550 RepID=A0A3N0BYD9_9SPHI|nr:hypothetical protein [Pedobacter jejuensis]RNL54272.1 hypothetical protein D7004_09285 [Pedobacter jejuensis]
MKKLCLIIPLLLIPYLIFADYGCLVPGYPELLTYQSNPPGGIFSNSPGQIYPSSGCQWTLDSTLPSAGCVGHGRGGIKGTYYQMCPIDDFLPAFFIFTAGIAFLQIRRKTSVIKYEDIYNHSSL